MKLVCDKEEFARLVRLCTLNEVENTCRGCMFCGLCATGNEPGPGVIMSRIEDICIVEGDMSG